MKTLAVVVTHHNTDINKCVFAIPTGIAMHVDVVCTLELS